MNLTACCSQGAAHHVDTVDQLHLTATHRLNRAVVGKDTTRKLKCSNPARLQNSSRIVRESAAARLNDQWVTLIGRNRAVVDKSGQPKADLTGALDRLITSNSQGVCPTRRIDDVDTAV